MTQAPEEHVPEVREVRGQVRDWRRGRAEMSLGEVVSETYSGIFAALVLGSMLVSVVVNLAAQADDLCTAEGCRAGRTLLPWLATGTVLLAVLALARLFGPVFSPPSEVSWLLTSPLPRARLLLPRTLVSLVGAAVTGAVAALGAFTLGGARGGALAWLTVLGTASGGLVVSLSAWAQVLDRPSARRLSLLLGGALVLATWGGAVALALDLVPATGTPRGSVALVAASLALVAGLLASAWWSLRRLDRLRSRALSPGGALVPGLGGALAGLDLALVHDVVTAHTWRARAGVRPSRGGPRGPWILVRYDVVRLRRRPTLLVTVVAAAVVPWTADAVGAGVATVPLAVVAGFLALLPGLVSLRVLTRTPSLARALPFEPWVPRVATCVVPGVLALVAGAVAAPALSRSLEVPLEPALLAGLAVGLGSLAAAVRWMTGRPPDYARPLVSTPAGGVPTNLYGSVLRGFDVALLVSTPLLFSTTATAAMVSLGLSAVVLAVLWGRR